MTDAEKLAVAIMRQISEDPQTRARVSNLSSEDILSMELCQKIAAILRREGAVIGKGGGPLV